MSTRPFYPGGPGHAVFNAAALQFAEDWNVANKPSFFTINTNEFGPVDRRKQNTLAELTAQPLGLWGASAFAALYPYQPAMRGTLAFPSADLPLVIQTKAGLSVTYAAAALTDMPPITFSSSKALFGNAKWSLLVAGGTDGTTAGEFVTIANSAYTAPALTPTAILTGRYVTAFGAGATGDLANIRTKAGFVVTPSTGWVPVVDDGITVNFRLETVGLKIAFEPINLTEADLYSTLLPMDGPGTGAGTSVSGLAGPLTITGVASGMPTLSVPLAFASESSLRFSTRDGRVGQVTLEALPPFVAGVQQNLFTFGTVS